MKDTIKAKRHVKQKKKKTPGLVPQPPKEPPPQAVLDRHKAQADSGGSKGNADNDEFKMPATLPKIIRPGPYGDIIVKARPATPSPNMKGGWSEPDWKAQEWSESPRWSWSSQPEPTPTEVQQEQSTWSWSSQPKPPLTEGQSWSSQPEPPPTEGQQQSEKPDSGSRVEQPPQERAQILQHGQPVPTELARQDAAAQPPQAKVLQGQTAGDVKPPQAKVLQRQDVQAIQRMLVEAAGAVAPAAVAASCAGGAGGAMSDQLAAGVVPIAPCTAPAAAAATQAAPPWRQQQARQQALYLIQSGSDMIRQGLETLRYLEVTNN